jgi:ATP-dependent metalloprotease
MGAERTSAYITPENKKLTAYHEAGHAVCCLYTPGAHPIHKATVMPRGRALGMVWQLPKGDQTSITMKEMLAKMDVCMGGRVAEEMIFGKDNVTSGASSDLQQATNIARGMVMSYGMSDRVGKTQFDPDRLHLVAPETRQAIDEEINRLLSQSYERAQKLLKKHSRDLEVVAKGLLEHETLSGEDVDALLNGRKMARELE